MGIFKTWSENAQFHKEVISVEWFMTRENEFLIDQHVHLSEALEAIGELLERVDFVIQTRMEAEGQKAIEHPDFDVALKYPPASYDQSKLMGILEVVGEETAIEAKAFVPAHEETTTTDVPAKWNVTKANTLRKFGDAVSAVIDGAKMVGRPRLVISRKEGETDGG